MTKAILFDMDGVIIDSEPIHRKAFYQAFKTLKIDVDSSVYESFTGQSTINVCQKLCEMYQPKISPEDFVELKRTFFYDIFDNDPTVHLIDGVFELIKNYSKNGLKLVIASSASMKNINSVFNRFGLNDYFIGKISGADLKESKPNPEIFEKAAKMTGFSKEECLVIEDSTNGIQAAYNANIFCVAFKSPHSKNQNYSKANLVINNFKDIYFDKLQNIKT